MKKLFGKFAISALFAVPLIFTASSASANYNGAWSGGCSNGGCFDAASRNLIDKVVEADAGWDWEPRCAGGARWSWHDMRCKGGTGDHHHKHKHHRHHH